MLYRTFILICIALLLVCGMTSAANNGSSAEEPLLPDGCVKYVEMDAVIKNGKIKKSHVKSSRDGGIGLQAMLNWTHVCPSTGDPKGIALCVDFSNRPGTQTIQHFNDLFFGTAPGGSLTEFFLEASYGLMDLDGAAQGWYRMPETFSVYESRPDSLASMIVDAVAAADAAGTDFSQFDSDSDGYVDALIIPISVSAGWRGFANHLDPGILVDGVRIGNVQFLPEDKPAVTFAHELGHQMGLPDLYAANPYPGNCAYIGVWSLMSTVSLHGHFSHPDAWCKVQLGWISPSIPSTNLTAVTVPPVETDPVAYKLWNNGNTSGEYFLVENRQKVGFDTQLPGSGLLIYHVLSDTVNVHQFMHVEEADGRFDLTKYYSPDGDGSDPWPGSLGKTSFDPVSDPNSLAWGQYHSSLVHLSAIHTSGSNVIADISVTLDAGTVRPYGMDVTPEGNAQPGTSAPMEDLCLQTTGSVTITGMAIERTGTATDADVPSVDVYDDADRDRILDEGETLIASSNFANGVASITGLSYSITGGGCRHMLAVYNISATAVVGRTLGLRIASGSSITVGGTETVDDLLMPIQSRNLIVSWAFTEVGWPIEHLMNMHGISPIIADVNANGFDDEIAYTWIDPPSIVSPWADWRIRVKSGVDGSSTILDLYLSDIEITHPLVAGDVDGNGRAEIIAVDVGGKLYIWNGRGQMMPGWPQSVFARDLALADLDGDGANEIVAGANEIDEMYGTPIADSGRVSVYRGNGKLLWRRHTGGTMLAPVVGDIDADGDPEVVAVSQEGKVFAWNHDGSAVDSRVWPMQLGSPACAPILADLDGDGSPEIIMAAGGEVHALRADGWSPAGTSWPATVSGSGISGLAAGEVSEEAMQIAATASDGTVYLFGADGTLADGDWPNTLGGGVQGSPIIVDIDQDGLGEILVAAGDKMLYGLDGDGSVSPGWQFPLSSDPGSSTPSAGDVDGDGQIEVLLSDNGRTTYRWEIRRPYANEALIWPTLQQSASHAGIGPGGSGPAVANAYHTDGTHVNVWFDEHVDEASAENPGNYAIDNGVTVQSATASEQSARTVVTLTTSSLPNNLPITVTVTGVSDLWGNLMSTNNQASFRTGPLQLTGSSIIEGIQSEVFFNRPLLSADGSNFWYDGWQQCAGISANFGDETVVLLTGPPLYRDVWVTGIQGLAGGTVEAGAFIVPRPRVLGAAWVDSDSVDVAFDPAENSLSQASVLEPSSYFINDGLPVTACTLVDEYGPVVRLTTGVQAPNRSYVLGVPGARGTSGCRSFGDWVLTSFSTPSMSSNAASLEFERSYIRLQANGTDSATLKVVLKDVYGNPAVTANNPVTIAITQGQNSAVLSQTTPITPQNGVVTVTCTATTVPGAIEVTAMSTGLQTVTLHGYVTGPVTEGWPSFLGFDSVYSSPAIADIDGDGSTEAVVGTRDGRLLSIEADGTVLEIKSGLCSISYAPAIANMDSDPQPEIVVATDSDAGGGQVWVLDYDGTVLPGWPQGDGEPTTVEASSSPAVADIDGDGSLEIIVGSSTMQVWAYNHDGTVAAGWPQNAMDPVCATPAIGDIDGDGDLEVVAGDYTGYIWAWNGDGSPVSTWPSEPQFGLGYALSSPALANLDDDGKMEIVVGTCRPDHTGYLLALNEDASYLSGWPITMNTGVCTSPAIGDLDGDGLLDIVVAGMNGRVYAVTPSAVPVTGWSAPYLGAATPYDGTYRQSSPVLADVDGDTSLKVLIGCQDGKLYAFNSNSSLVAGWPKATGGPMTSTPAIGNLDGDNYWDAVVGSGDGGIHRWEIGPADTASTPASLFPWTTFHGDNQRTGAFWHTVASLPRIGDLADCADGTRVRLAGCTVSRAFDADHVFYVESADRSSGVRVAPKPWMPLPAQGDQVDVVGILHTGSGVERYVEVLSIMTTTSANAIPESLGMRNNWLGGISYGTASGIAQPNPPNGPCDLYNIGLLVNTWGVVTAVEDDYFYIDDGAELQDGSSNVGVCARCYGFAPPYDVGDYVHVIGISSMSGGHPQLLVSSIADVDVLSGTVVQLQVSPGSMLIGLNRATIDPDPSSVFSSIDNWSLDGNLVRRDACTGLDVYYDAEMPDGFGSVLIGEGYWLLNLAQSDTIEYQGVDVSDSDHWLSLPKTGWSIVSHPFAYNVPWASYLVTNGKETKTLTAASGYGAGWLNSYGYFWCEQGICDFGLEEDWASVQEWYPGHGYWVETYVDGLALIAPRVDP